MKLVKKVSAFILKDYRNVGKKDNGFTLSPKTLGVFTSKTLAEEAKTAMIKGRDIPNRFVIVESVLYTESI